MRSECADQCVLVKSHLFGQISIASTSLLCAIVYNHPISVFNQCWEFGGRISPSIQRQTLCVCIAQQKFIWVHFCLCSASLCPTEMKSQCELLPGTQFFWLLHLICKFFECAFRIHTIAICCKKESTAISSQGLWIIKQLKGKKRRTAMEILLASLRWEEILIFCLQTTIATSSLYLLPGYTWSAPSQTIQQSYQVHLNWFQFVSGFTTVAMDSMGNQRKSCVF